MIIYMPKARNPSPTHSCMMSDVVSLLLRYMPVNRQLAQAAINVSEPAARKPAAALVVSLKRSSSRKKTGSCITLGAANMCWPLDTPLWANSSSSFLASSAWSVGTEIKKKEVSLS